MNKPPQSAQGKVTMARYEAVTEALRLAAKETEHLRVSPRDRQSLEINMADSDTTRPEAGESRYDYHGPIRCMAVHDNWIMCRRPHARPFVMSVKDWHKLLIDKVDVGKSMAPRASHYGVLA